MKKKIFLFASAALLLTGCAKEPTIATPDSDGTVKVSVSTMIQNKGLTRASWDNDGNGAEVDHWIMEVYDASGKLFYRKEKTGQSGLTNTFNVLLIKNQSYTFAFWADKQGSYDTAKLSEVKTVSTVAGLDSRDAFFANKAYVPTDGTTISAQLHRPFAQINIVTLDLQKIWDQMYAAGTQDDFENYEPEVLKLTCEAYSQFNVLTGTASNAQSTEFTLASCYADFAAHAAKTTIFMDYLFAGAEKELKNLAFTFKSNGVDINYSFTDFANIPLQRNYRTNISGNLLSNDATVTVDILPAWSTSEYDETYP